IAVACVSVCVRDRLSLEDPGVGGDRDSVHDLWKIVQELVGSGIGVVWSTAYLDEAELCQAVILLHEGKKIFDGEPRVLTDRVRARTFHLRVSGNRRKILAEALRSKAVVDGVVQGDSVRLVLKENAKPEELAQLSGNRKLEPVPPRFEDAFIDALGGLPKTESLVAQAMRQLEHNGGDVIEVKDLT